MVPFDGGRPEHDREVVLLDSVGVAEPLERGLSRAPSPPARARMCPCRGDSTSAGFQRPLACASKALRSVPLALRNAGCRDQARRLVDHQQAVVLVQDRHRNVFGARRRSRAASGEFDRNRIGRSRRASMVG